MESINFASPNISINNFDKQMLEEGVCGTNQRGENANLYSFPGILHFLQSEWNKMETERAHWDIEKAELMAKIAFLQGEKKGQENLKEDLVRRIKMLEYALKQKNQTINELKYGVTAGGSVAGGAGGAVAAGAGCKTSNNNVGASEDGHGKARASEAASSRLMTDIEKAKIAGTEWRESRQRLRQFLQEVGYVDTIVDARQIRLRNILSENFFSKLMDDQGRIKHVDESLLDVENSVMKTFEFLGQEKDKNIKGDEMSGETGNFDGKKQLDDDTNWTNQFANRSGVYKIKGGKDDKFFAGLKDKGKGYPKMERFGRASKKDSDIQDLLSHLSEDNFHGEDFNSDKDLDDSRIRDKKSTNSQNVNDMDNYCSSFGLGDLASITVTNDADGENLDASKSFCGSSPNQRESGGLSRDKVDSGGLASSASMGGEKKFWNVKYTLRGHFDSVRSISFYKSESAVVSGSDDGTVKVWNFNKAQLSKKGPNMEIEAVQTMRGHDSPVLAVHVIDEDIFRHGGGCPIAVSGALDGSIRFWALPNLEIDPYELFDPVQNALNIAHAHTNAVWRVTSLPSTTDPVVLSVSPFDIKLWSLLSGDGFTSGSGSAVQDGEVYRGNEIAACLLKEFKLTNLLTENGLQQNSRISSVSVLKQDPNQLVLGTSTGQMHILDIQSENIKTSIDMSKSDTILNNSWNDQGIHSMTVHPTLPLVFSGHEDHYLRTVDLRTSSMVHSMVVHQDPVSCVDIDKNGIYLLTGSHDGSLRMWDMEKKTCIQEIASHRIKNNESVHAVSFHSQMPFIGSCGAEGIVKIYS